MYDKFFGSFLLNKKSLSKEELRNILAHMQDVRIKIGTLAMSEGLMKGTQVETVFQIQKKTDKKFGEIAVELGYLTGKQVEELLKYQSSESNLQLGQAAVDLGYLNYEKLDHELESFKNDSGLSRIQLKILEEGDTDKIIKEFIDFDRSANSEIYYDYVSLLLRNIIRFLDQQPWIDIHNEDDLDDKLTVYQFIENESRIFTGLCIDAEDRDVVAEHFARMPIDNDLELAEASLKEFLNLQNGIFTVNLSGKGLEYQMQPPEISRGSLLEEIASGHRIGINMGIGKIVLVLAPF
ncbi:MAG: hypothetical protein GX364_02420 [Firmicutes bacterium]|jgi:hypothetical protein|nr:hypothetical protein [Bacillota bacterium]